MQGGEFYAEGRRVFKAPADHYVDGKLVGASLGFPVCRIEDCIGDPEKVAAKIAELLEADRRRQLPLAERKRLNGVEAAARLTAAQRRERAQKAAAARWGRS